MNKVIVTCAVTGAIYAPGRAQMPIATMSAAMGAHVRVGLVDSLWDGPSQLAKTNAERGRRIRTVIEAFA